MLETQEKTRILDAIEGIVKALRYGGQEVTVASVRQAIAEDTSFPPIGELENIPDAWIVPFLRRPTRAEISADLLEDLRRETMEARHLTQCEHDHDFDAMLRSIMLDLEILAMKYNSALKAFYSMAGTDEATTTDE
jgi:hypothetical protein